MNLKSHDIVVFTDGASRGNPGPGGFGAILVLPKQNEKNNEARIKNHEVREIGGREEHTTNNRMELRAAIEALLRIKDKGLRIVLYSDSSYLINGITKWISGWQKNHWKTAQKKEVENRDLWETLAELTEGKNIEWKYVGGHVGVVGNERCDAIATAFADGKEVKLYSGILENYGIKDIMNLQGQTLGREKGLTLKSRSRKPVYSYVSMVDRKIMTHKTWAECEARVKGVRGARCQKVFSSEEESALIEEWYS